MLASWPDAKLTKLRGLLRTHGSGGGNPPPPEAVRLDTPADSTSLPWRPVRSPQGGQPECLNFVKSVGTTDPDEIEQFVRDTLSGGGKIFGFGHAVLRAEDPRATVQYGLGREICGDDPLFKTALAMRERAVKVLKENPKISNPYPNVDAVSGTLLNASGLTDAEYYTLLFGFARIAGITAQIVDERVHMRNGRGVPIYRCSYVAENQDPRRLG